MLGPYLILSMILGVRYSVRYCLVLEVIDTLLLGKMREAS
jgi:hypothetical protein